ncbi:MAG: PqqD family protein [Chloroflexota bacterium]
MRRLISGPDPNVIGRRMGPEFVLIHLQTDRVYALNRTGARCWELLGELRDREQILARLAREFGVRAAMLADELDLLFASLVRERLVVAGVGRSLACEPSAVSVGETDRGSRDAWEPMDLRYLGNINEFVQAGGDKSRHRPHRHHGW